MMVFCSIQPWGKAEAFCPCGSRGQLLLFGARPNHGAAHVPSRVVRVAGLRIKQGHHIGADR